MTIDHLKRDLSKLASANRDRPNFESFRSGVWREIRHRQAVECISIPASFWRWGLFDFGVSRLALPAFCVAACVGVALEARELKDQEERAKSLDIALRHPLKCEEQVAQMSSSPASPEPTRLSPTLQDTASAKATPAISPQKGLRLLPNLKLDRERHAIRA